MSDEPLMVARTPVRDLELAAIAAYRAAYPDAPQWQELHSQTRMVWMRHVERASNAMRTPGEIQSLTGYTRQAEQRRVLE